MQTFDANGAQVVTINDYIMNKFNNDDTQFWINMIDKVQYITYPLWSWWSVI